MSFRHEAAREVDAISGIVQVCDISFLRLMDGYGEITFEKSLRQLGDDAP